MESSSPQQLVYQALQYACSQDTNLIKQAEEKLSEWEKESGFYLTLLSIFTNHQADVNVRWMAAVYFKNGVNKYWRRNVENEIQASEKAQIRVQLISNFNEPVPQIAVQIAASIAKIARLDYPKEWPELVPVIIEAIKNSDSLQQHRALLVLHHIIKAICSRRLLPDRKIFQKLTQNIYSFILNLWDGFTKLFFQSVQENATQDVIINYLERALLTLRMLHKLTIFGMRLPIKSEDCMLFIEAIFHRAKESLECRYELKRRQSSDGLIEMIEKFILKLMKILNEFLEQHPISFVNHVSTALEFSFNYVFYTGTNLIYEGNTICFTHFAIRCINLMKGILSSVAYKSSKSDEYNNYSSPHIITTLTESAGVARTASSSSTSSSSSSSINIGNRTNSVKKDNDTSDKTNLSPGVIAKQKFFTAERLSYICEKIITHYFLLTQSDLDLWIDDPEGFASDEGGESWKYALRPCTETFFLTLFNQFKDEMLVEVLKYVRKAQQMTLTLESDLKEILLKDAIYTAIGLVAFHFYSEIDFDTWFTHQLLDEIKIPADNFRIIRRKVIWLIGQWTSVKLSRNLRPTVYETCLELLKSQEDMSVRLAASKTLMSTINDFEFESEPFLPYLEPCFSSLFSLLKEVKECDTKMNVLCIMSFIVEKMSDNIQPQADNLIAYLPLLWKESEDHNMLRCAIISTLTQIVRAICEVPSMLLPFLYPVIEISCDIDNSSSVYLIEEGLELWLTVVENSTTLTAELLDLAGNLIRIVEKTSENLRTVLYIMQAYVILNSEVFLQRYGKNIVSTCAYLMTDMRQEGIVVVLKLFETYLRTEPNIGIELIKPVLPSIFKQIYMNEMHAVDLMMYLTIISHVLIINQTIFIEALQETNLSRSLEIILDVWISKMSRFTNSYKIKLMSLALGSILTVDNNIIYERFPGIMQNIVETLNDIMKKDDELGVIDSLVLADEAEFDASDIWIDEDSEQKTYHYQRLKQICMRDPVYRIVLKDYIQAQLLTLKQNLGDERYQSLMLTVDYTILSELADHLNIFINI